MTSRCEMDPFEPAVDVCDRCYANICAACIVELRGRSDPVCRECALDMSAVRSRSGRPDRSGNHGDRTTVKQRRKENRAAATAMATAQAKLLGLPIGDEPLPAAGTGDPTPPPSGGWRSRIGLRRGQQGRAKT